MVKRIFLPGAILTLGVCALVIGFSANRAAKSKQLTFYQTIRSSAAVIVGSGKMGTASYIGNRRFLTAGHVCNGMELETLKIMTMDRKDHKVVSFSIAPEYPNIDLCIVTSADELSKEVTVAQLDLREEVMTGQKAFIGGFSGGKPYSFRMGFSYLGAKEQFPATPGYEPFESYIEWIAVDVEGGASGGGVFDERGKLRGVVIIRYTGRGTGIVPAFIIKKFLVDQGVLQDAQSN